MQSYWRVSEKGEGCKISA